MPQLKSLYPRNRYQAWEDQQIRHNRIRACRVC